jgi:hypothetical protein
MSSFVRKFIAVLLAIWLPLFSGGANGSCHEAGMDTMQDMDEHQHAMSHDQSPNNDQDGTSCTACAVCHLACSGYLGVQAIKNLEVLQSAISVTPYLFSYHSITSTPVVPPPLA